MKKFTCEDDGFVAMGETEKEVMDKLWEHMKTEHPEQLAEMMKKSPAEKEKMMEETRMAIEDA